MYPLGTNREEEFAHVRIEHRQDEDHNRVSLEEWDEKRSIFGDLLIYIRFTLTS